ncbi:MAG: bifunctional phosphopantothenoylcysteine decarboxylase/phosphopantothenate--cysteine ligase CoaBC [Clostridia bacterium]|nr:bifunctional phosphopantothenoylcysteine decarboxylase/phosphopantothenate--cysteine ligase CoaBC [Clostridia bacterium]
MRKRVLLGVTGGIAAYKAPTIAGALKRAGVDVSVVMTDAATKFITPLTMETTSGNRVITDMFSRDFPYEVEHISLAKASDLVLVAPATANFIGKVARGIADDMLSTTIMACKGIKVFAPAMNTGMITDPAYEENVEILKKRGAYFIESDSGALACGDVGKGRLPEPQAIVDYVLDLLKVEPDYLGKKVLVTAGATVETIDGVRYISNFSSGKMGIAIADEAFQRGADVTLVCGRVTAPVPSYLKRVDVTSSADMYDAVVSRALENDVIIKAAAPADYTPKAVAKNKIKSDTLTLELVKTKDIAQAVGEIKGDRLLVIFSAETESLLDNALGKLKKKNADLVVANDVTEEGAGFNVDTNIVTLIDREGNLEKFDKMPKAKVANVILDKVKEIWSRK